MEPVEEKKIETSTQPAVASEATPPTASPTPTNTAASQSKSPVGIWIFAVVFALVLGLGGYALGSSSQKKNPEKTSTLAPSPTTVASEKKQPLTKISGSVKTDARNLDYLIVDISQYGNVKATNHQERIMLKPQGNIEYAYTFENLDPKITYTVVMQGCKDSEKVSACVESKKVVNCSGRIPTDTKQQQCLIRGDGNADFFLDQNLVSNIDVALTGTPTPTPTVPASVSSQ